MFNFLILDKNILIPSTKGIQYAHKCYYPKQFMFDNTLMELVDLPIINITGLCYKSNKSIIEYLKRNQFINNLTMKDLIKSINKIG